LGQTVVANLFGTVDPIGQIIRVQQIPCQVLGVMAVKGQSAIGQDQDDVVLIPYTVVQKQIKGITWLDDILCSAVSAEAIPLAEPQVAALLRERHHGGGGQEDGFDLAEPAGLPMTPSA